MVAEGPAVAGRLLTFRVGRGRFAVALESVLGVVDPVEAGARSRGEVVFQGRAVAAVDARTLGWGCAEPVEAVAHPAAIIVSSDGGGATAVIVDQVEGIVEGVEVRPLPALVVPFVRGAFRGFALHPECGRLLVDPAAIPGVRGKTAAESSRREPGEA